MDEMKTSRPLKRRLKTAGIVVLAVLAVAGTVTSAVLWSHGRHTDQAQAERLAPRLGKTVELPDATPSIVTVVDKTKLANQTLASRVADQDMLLIYSQAKRIVIYRPSSGKVVDMLSFEAPGQLLQNQRQPGTAQTP